MPRRISSSSQALLGLLTIAPMSGYELGRNVRASVGHIWNESYGQIYPNLRKLAATGLVSVKTERQKGKPDRHLYTITPAGRDAMSAWLGIPPQAEVPRNEMLLKLFFGALVQPSVLIRYIEHMVFEHRALLEQFTRIEQEDIAGHAHRPEAVFWTMTARYGQMEMEAHLRWAEETLALLHKLPEKQAKPSGRLTKPRTREKR